MSGKATISKKSKLFFIFLPVLMLAGTILVSRKHVHKYAGMFGPLYTFITKRNGKTYRILASGGGWQSIQDVVSPFAASCAYYGALDTVAHATLLQGAETRVLLLGAGACVWPAHLVETTAHTTIDAVEIDPCVLAIAQNEFHIVASPRLNLICADGLCYLANTKSNHYSLIVLDAFQGLKFQESFLQPHVLAQMQSALKPGGVVAVNVSVSAEDPGLLLQTRTALEELFDFVCTLPCPDEVFAEDENYLVLASDEPLQIDGAQNI